MIDVEGSDHLSPNIRITFNFVPVQRVIHTETEEITDNKVKAVTEPAVFKRIRYVSEIAKHEGNFIEIKEVQ